MIVVTTPTGNIGGQVLRLLLDAGRPVRAIVREPARLPADLSARIEVVAGSHGDAAVVDEAFAGAEAVFWLVPPNFRAESLEAAYLDFTRPACAAIRSRGVKRVVGVSALGRGVAGNAGLVSAALAMDDLIASTGVAYRALALPSFMDNVLRQVEPIRARGVFVAPIAGDLRCPTCATGDIAAVAARLLLDPAWSGRADVPVLGPEDLSFDEMATIMSEVLGKPVRFERIPLEAYAARLSEAGASEAMVRGMVDMMVAKNAGLDNAAPRTPETTSPTSFRHWCEAVLKPAVLGYGSVLGEGNEEIAEAPVRLDLERRRGDALAMHGEEPGIFDEEAEHEALDAGRLGRRRRHRDGATRRRGAGRRTRLAAAAAAALASPLAARTEQPGGAEQLRQAHAGGDTVAAGDALVADLADQLVEALLERRPPLRRVEADDFKGAHKPGQLQTRI